MVSFRSSRKIVSYLLSAKLYALDRVAGSSICGKKPYQKCDNISKMDTFAGTVTSETYKLNHNLNCDNKCLIDLNSMLGEALIVLSNDGIVTNLITAGLLEMKYLCKNTYLGFLAVKTIRHSWKTFP